MMIFQFLECFMSVSCICLRLHPQVMNCHRGSRFPQSFFPSSSIVEKLYVVIMQHTDVFGSLIYNFTENTFEEGNLNL